MIIIIIINIVDNYQCVPRGYITQKLKGSTTGKEEPRAAGMLQRKRARSSHKVSQSACGLGEDKQTRRKNLVRY